MSLRFHSGWYYTTNRKLGGLREAAARSRLPRLRSPPRPRRGTGRPQAGTRQVVLPACRPAGLGRPLHAALTPSERLRGRGLLRPFALRLSQARQISNLGTARRFAGRGHSPRPFTVLPRLRWCARQARLVRIPDICRAHHGTPRCAQRRGGLRGFGAQPPPFATASRSFSVLLDDGLTQAIELVLANQAVLAQVRQFLKFLLE